MRALLGIVALVSGGCEVSEDPNRGRVPAATENDLKVQESSYGEARNDDLGPTGDDRTRPDKPAKTDLRETNFPAGDELCLQASPEICVRAGDAQILESIDGGQTYATAWELDLRGEWLTRQLDTFGRATIRNGTMAETGAGAVVVTLGDLAPVRRAPDGEWSPSEAQLRAFPIGGTLWALAGIAMLAIAFASNGIRVRLVILGSGLIYLGTLTMRLPSHELRILAAAIGILAATAVCVNIMVIKSLGDDGALPQDYTDPWRTPARVAPWALPTVLLPLTMSAWAWDLMSWDVAEILWFGGIGISFVISLIQMRRQETQAKVGAQS